MVRKTAVAAATAVALALAVPAAFAASSGTAMQTTGTEMMNETPSPAAIKAFESVKVTLPQAISAAEQHSNGKAFDVSFSDQNGTPAWEVKTFQNNSVWEGNIDANSGQLVGQGKTVSESQLDQEDKAELSALDNAKTTLSEAVQKAEQRYGGNAIDAGLEQTGGQVAYQMALVKNGALQKASVDPTSGEVAALPSQESGSSTAK